MSGAPEQVPVGAARATRIATLQSRSAARPPPCLVPFFRNQAHDHFGHVRPSMSLAMDLNLSTLEGAYLLVQAGRDGVVFDADGRLIRETCFFADADFSLFTLDYLRTHAVDVEQPLFLSFDGSWRNYYHWTVLGLGRSMIYNRLAGRHHATIVFDYLSRESRTWRIGFSHDLWRDSMAATGVASNCRILRDGIYRLRSLDFLWQSVDQPPYLCFFSSFYTGFDEIACDGAPPAARTRRIVVARAKDPRLTPTAADAVGRLVDTAGFELVDFEALDFAEQVKLMGLASVIVAPHGAGLSNLLYAPASTKIIELNRRLNGEHQLRPWFYLLAAGKGQRYSYLDLDTFSGTPGWICDRVLELAFA